MFVDKVSMIIKAGDGGNGVISFRHEKFVDRGGPDGGDGGRGGDIIFQASRNQDTLAAFRYKKMIQAENGYSGSKRRQHGKNATDLLIQVPVGTVVIKKNQSDSLNSNDNEILADLYKDEQKAVIATGGRGGFGNAHFVSSKRQAPRLAEKGNKGQVVDVIIELKMIADVGLVGLPNAGKSTLLASISNARPEIANYPFTTLTPNLGVVDIDKNTGLLVADIPGLIEGASTGKGLGDEFLRHIERTSVLVHLIDIYQDVAKAYEIIQHELKAYKINLTKRLQVVVLNKVDGVDEQTIQNALKQLKKVVPQSTPLMTISAKSKQGIPELLFSVSKLVSKQDKKQEIKDKDEVTLPVLRLPESANNWQITTDNDVLIVTGNKIEKFAERTDFSNPEAVERLRIIMRKLGITHELLRKSQNSKKVVKIGKPTIGRIEF